MVLSLCQDILFLTAVRQTAPSDVRKPLVLLASALLPFMGNIKCHGQYYMKGSPPALFRQHEYLALVVL
ncbi:MAG: hypothetical protein WA913_15635 [Pricia sp.]